MDGRVKHRRRCPACKTAVRDLLTQFYGAVEVNWAPGWPCRLDELAAITPVWPVLSEIYQALVDYREHTSFVRAKRMPRCDFFVPGSPGFIVEYDEAQHFTEPRSITLGLLPKDYPLGFDVNLWKRECERIHARDNDPPFRDEQRAWYDVLRDVIPPSLGMGPTVRIMDTADAFCLIDTGHATALETFRRSLIPAG